jgi:hypothetical protein
VNANAGLSEERVRIICHLPYRDAVPYRETFQKIVEYIQQQRARVVPVTGYTYSSLRPRVFFGFWWGVPDSKRDDQKAKAEWVPDEIVMLMIDLATNLHDRRLEKFVDRLKARILKVYQQHGCSQDEIWIIAQDSFRS